LMLIEAACDSCTICVVFQEPGRGESRWATCISMAREGRGGERGRRRWAKRCLVSGRAASA
jgi:hypothetical protein